LTNPAFQPFKCAGSIQLLHTAARHSQNLTTYPACGGRAQKQCGVCHVFWFTEALNGSVGEHRVTDEEIMEVGIKWDPQPFHTDPVLAKESLFGGLVASSVHLFGISVRLSAEVPADQRTAAVSALGFDNMKLISPVMAGDNMRLKSKVLDARPSLSKPQLGIITLTSDLINQNDEAVFVYEFSALVKRKG